MVTKQGLHSFPDKKSKDASLNQSTEYILMMLDWNVGDLIESEDIH